MTVPLVPSVLDRTTGTLTYSCPVCSKKYSIYQGKIVKSAFRIRQECTAKDCPSTFLVAVDATPPAFPVKGQPEIAMPDPPVLDTPPAPVVLPEAPLQVAISQPSQPEPVKKKGGRPRIYSDEEYKVVQRERQIRKSEKRKERRRLAREAGVPLQPVQPEPENPLQLHEPGKRSLLTEEEKKAKRKAYMYEYDHRPEVVERRRKNHKNNARNHRARQAEKEGRVYTPRTDLSPEERAEKRRQYQNDYKKLDDVKAARRIQRRQKYRETQITPSAPVAPSPLRETPKEIRIDGLPGGISITIIIAHQQVPV